ENGVIKIPEKYQKDISGNLRVIILMEKPEERKPCESKNPFNAIRIKTKDFRFNREEANER
ncbi:MAG TPA: hypothetical protein PL110_17830, partial [Candidatus Eremiobacteraeota bacterium]|nr:hypothetical protein [Candidatus Eremiobacteraeota bacterium]